MIFARLNHPNTLAFICMLAFRERCLRLSGQTDSSDPRIFILDLTSSDLRQTEPNKLTSSRHSDYSLAKEHDESTWFKTSSHRIKPVGFLRMICKKFSSLSFPSGGSRIVSASLPLSTSHDTFFFSLSISVNFPSEIPTKISGVTRIEAKSTPLKADRSWRYEHPARTTTELAGRKNRSHRRLSPMAVGYEPNTDNLDYEDRTDSVKPIGMFGISSGLDCLQEPSI